MDLGLQGRWAVVCGASRGLGYACAEALAAEGVSLVLNARSPAALAEAALTLRRRFGGEVRVAAGDVATVCGRATLLSQAPRVDILVTNAAGPPPGAFRDFERKDWLAALETNMLAPLELIRSVLDGMAERGFGRIVNITSAAAKAPIDFLCLSNGARAGLTGAVAGVARQAAARGVTINNLLPGAFETERLRSALAQQAASRSVPVEDLTAHTLGEIPAGRFGAPPEFGRACAFLCAASSGYITGQNLLIDGGAYRGVF